MNLQAICNHKRRFISIDIRYGASASDHIAFEVSDLRQDLSEEGFLACGLVLFGDNAYVNTVFMVTPYPNTTQNTPRDNYNFFSLTAQNNHRGRVWLAHPALGHAQEADAEGVHPLEDCGGGLLPVPPPQVPDRCWGG